MKIMIIYATYSSGTLVAAEKVQEFLQAKGHDAYLLRADGINKIDFEAPELIIMGSPSWKVMGKEGMAHEWYFAMMDRLKEQQVQVPKKFAVFALGDESYADVCGSYKHLVSFVEQLGGTLAIDPLKLEGFYFAKDKRVEEIRVWVDELLAKLG